MDSDIPRLETLIFHVTGSCNLRCRHCWQRAKPDTGVGGSADPGRSVTLEMFARFLAEAVSLGLKWVKFTGGEPLLHPNFPDYLKIAADQQLSIIIETNGTLVDEALAIGFGRLKNVSISVSLDGSTADIHDEFRGVPGAYRKTLSGLKLLAEHGLAVQIITCLHRGNLSDLESIIRLAREYGAGSMKINPVQPMGRGGDLDHRGGFLTVPELLDVADRCQRRPVPEFSGGLMFSLPLAFRPFAVIRERQFAVCRIHHILGLLPNGDLSFCGVGNIDPSLVIGNIFTGRLAELWHRAPLMRGLRQGLPHKLTGVCALCILKAVCLGECRALAYERTRDLMGPYWICQEAFEAGLFPESRLISNSAGEKHLAAAGSAR